MKQNQKKGFTMTELIVVIVITVILAAVLIPSVVLYIRRAEFRKNNENAQTVYLTAETMLTYYRSSGQWEEFCEQVKEEGTLNKAFASDTKLANRIYAITLERGAYDSTDETNLVNQLLGSLTYDSTTMEDGAISIEIDIETGQVYSAFYATRCENLNYDDDDGDDTLTMNLRTYDERKSRLLGYYSVEDVTNVAKLDSVRLKVTSLSLVNSETLSLNWSSNSKHNNLDVNYEIKFYKKGDSTTPLFTTTLDLGSDASTANVVIGSGKSDATTMVGLALKDGNGNDAGKWYFPISYKDGTISLVLDAMMSADVIEEQELYASALSDSLSRSAANAKAAYIDLLQTKSTSITRLANEAKTVNSAFAEPMDIYATVKAEATYNVNYTSGDSSEYNTSAEAKSNTENTLYVKGAEQTTSGKKTKVVASLTTMRHLSNIRYCDSDSAAFTIAKNMDWKSVGAGVYDASSGESGKDKRLTWKDSKGTLAFPSIPTLRENYTLTARSGAKISNLVFNEDSVADDQTTDTLAQKAGSDASYAEYIGLFCESNGTITNLTLEDPSVTLIADEDGEAFTTSTNEMETAISKIVESGTAEKDFSAAKDSTGAVRLGHIRGVGIVAGRAQGTLSGITITTKDASTRIMTVCLEKAGDATDKNQKSAGVGGIVGVLAKSAKSGGYDNINKNTVITDLSVSGTIWAYLPSVINNNINQSGDDSAGDFADDYHYGVGGIIGYGNLRTKGAQITACANAAAVTANYFAGGVCGHLEGHYNKDGDTSNTIDGCTNTGLILSNAQYSDELAAGTNKIYMQGQFFGGILGFGQNTKIYNSTSSAGSAAGYTYVYANRKNLLVGQYVGGILGYGSQSQISDCSTKSGGYVLGSDYVGGIVGAMAGGNTSSTISTSGSNATTNASFVIGNSYVGGIVGENKKTEVIQDCVNNGVAVAYKEYAGGIVGYNAGTIQDCSSYLSDYDGDIYDTITNTWHADGDCVGGIAGYNDGEIKFDKEQSTAVQVKAVSNVTTGKNYVGGIIGFNDVNGKLEIEYDLIAGSIYATGDCAGGAIGLNASVDVLEINANIQPQRVVGNNCVGGVIGANVVNLTDSVTMSGLTADNRLCTITANAFAGGLIGWHCTYTPAQLRGEEKGTITSLYEWMTTETETGGTNADLLLPQLEGGLVVDGITTGNANYADTKHTLTISDAKNEKSMTHSTNTIDITANAYVGGIVGSCDENSSLEIENCINAGALTLRTDELSVAVSDFLKAEELTDAQEEIQEAETEIGGGAITTQFAGGIIGLNGYNQVIRHCENKGTLTGFTALGGIAGVNMGYVIDCELTENFGSAAMDYVGGIVGINVGNDKGKERTFTITTTEIEKVEPAYADWEQYRQKQIEEQTKEQKAEQEAAFREEFENQTYKFEYSWNSSGSVSKYTDQKYVTWCEQIWEDYVEYRDNGMGKYRYRNSALKSDTNGEDGELKTSKSEIISGEYKKRIYDAVRTNDYIFVFSNGHQKGGVQPVTSSTSEYWNNVTDVKTKMVKFPNPTLSKYEALNDDAKASYMEDAYQYWKDLEGKTYTYTYSYDNWETYKKKHLTTETKTSQEEITCTAGTVIECAAAENCVVSGKSVVGGIAGYNLLDGKLVANTCSASVSGARSDVGGIAGRNAGTIIATTDTSTTARTIASSSGNDVGGLVGYNEEEGTVEVSGDVTEIVAVSSAAQISGYSYVGGLIGGNAGKIQTGTIKKTSTDENGNSTTEDVVRILVSEAASVRAYNGYAGGAIGRTKADVENLGSRCDTVAANTGYAGGILPENEGNQTIKNCFAIGTVRSDTGYAGGITAVNNGTIEACTVGDADGKETTCIDSEEKSVGAVTSVNYGTIRDCGLNKEITISCTGTEYGGLTGRNYGTITAESVAITDMPEIDSGKTGLSVGAAAATNYADATIENVTVSCDFASFSTYKYFGGVVGENQENGTVTGCTYAGTITETGGSAGNCYGGIVGVNAGTLKACTLKAGTTMTVQGVYVATSESAADDSATHAGGIVGKNEESGAVSACFLENSEESILTAENGMLGGVAGFNKGEIVNSGDKSTVSAMLGEDGTGVTGIAELCDLTVDGASLSADANFVSWSGSNIEEQLYNQGSKVTANRIQMIVKSNGNLGGITAYNAGALSYCASGTWFLNNKSTAIDVGTGGVIGMNDTEENLSFLLNRAFVGRQLADVNTDRSAGGVIGTQNNTSAEGWTLTNCVNYGTVYCRNTDYAGGVIGQWTGTGGTVKDCRNYGNLQTTYTKQYFGASGGIVAQLYHAQRDNEYDIISCENYGSVYAKAGETTADCANYSAGILGTITNYEVTNAESTWRDASTPCTVRVLDCVNGPGVEIYSSTIASGIVGFLTCDNPNDNNGGGAGATKIASSTLDVELYIERCRNFASVLKGASATGGILGDRMVTAQKSRYDGASNTYLYDNISVSLNEEGLISGYYKEGLKNTNGKPNSGRNYFIDSTSFEFESLSLTEDDEDTGSGSANPALKYVRTASDGLSTAQLYVNGNRGYIVYDETAGKFVLIGVDGTRKDGNTTVGNTLSGSASTIIKETLYIVEKANTSTQVGRVLCELSVDNSTYQALSGTITADQSGKTNRSKALYTLLRETYRSLEGVDESGKLIRPKSVATDIGDGGRMTVTITPGTRLTGQEDCDPFAYEVRVLSADGTVVQGQDDDGSGDRILIYKEDGSFTLSEAVKKMTGNITVQVRAVSMYDDVEPSEWVEKKTEMEDVLPDPVIRVELVRDNRTYNNNDAKFTRESMRWQWRFTLENASDYEELAYADKITISVKFGSMTRRLTLGNGWESQVDWTGTRLMMAQAQVESSTGVANSSWVTASTFLSPGKPKDLKLENAVIPVKGNLKAEFDGETKDELSITATIDATGRTVDTSPIYEVDLIGTYEDEEGNTHENTVLATQDLLVASNTTSTVTFEDLPNTILKATNLQIRVWYASTGLGPAYTWSEVDTEEESNVQIYADGKWSYRYSEVLTGNSENFKDLGKNVSFTDYTDTSETLFTWLDAPTFYYKDGTRLNAAEDEEDGTALHYRFYWDAESTCNFNSGANEYAVELYGVTKDADGENKVLIGTYESGDGNITTGEVDGEKAYMLDVDADDWSYTQIYLKVSRLGDGKTTVGQSSHVTYSVRQRLESPSQPAVSIVSSDELDYTVTWAAITDETDCESYTLWMQKYDDEASDFGDAEALKTVSASGKETYTTTVSLDEYAGARIRLYVVANAADDSDTYVDSAAGISYEMTVLTRVELPGDVTFTFPTDWTYDRSNPFSTTKFLQSGLTVYVSSKTAPPGGSTYLLRAYVYDTEADANKAISDVTGGAENNTTVSSLAGYKAAYVMKVGDDGSITVTPVSMTSETTYKYVHTVLDLSTEYAGRWIVFQTRISSSGGAVSSVWKTSEPKQLPYVQLDQPTVSSDVATTDITASISSNPDAPANEVAWHAQQTTYTWQSVTHADLYTMTVQDVNNDDGTTGTAHKLRFIEHAADTDAGTGAYIGVQVYDEEAGEWHGLNKVEDGVEAEVYETETVIGNGTNEVTFYTKTATGYYTPLGSTSEQYYTATFACTVQVAQNADGTWQYTLTLPDPETVADDEGSTIDTTVYFTQNVELGACLLQNQETDESRLSDQYVDSEIRKILVHE